MNEILEMGISEIAGLSFECGCGQTHSVDIKKIIIGSQVIEKIIDVASDFKNGKIFLIADNNTFKVCGNRVKDLLLEKDFNTNLYVFETDHPLIPDEAALGRLFIEASADTSLIIAVGSGTINDLARMVSFKMKIPYISVATAPSMDGYASIVSPLIVEGTKVTYTAVYPYAIIADMDIMKEAPMHMLQAGFGDILGKLTALSDWDLARTLNGEYYCDTCASMVKTALAKCRDNIDGIISRRAEAIMYLTEALILSGVAIGMAGTSRPASGSEHHIAHYWEVDAIKNGQEHALHGNCVGTGTVVSSMLYALMLDKLPEGVNPPNYDDVAALLNRIGAAADPAKLGISRELFTRSVINAKDIRSRYSIFNYTQEAGLLEEYAELLTKRFYEGPDVLKEKKLYILDMDGTFYLGDKIIEGALEFIHKLVEAGIKFLFFTNNSSKVSEFYVNKLSRMGLDVSKDDVLTSGDVTMKYLHEKHSGKKVFLLGTELLENSFRQEGISLVQNNPDIVVAGFDTTIDYEKLSKACKFIREGALFIATHPDFNCPTEDGFIPDCGAICSFITASTGVKPKILGKPNIETVEMIKIVSGMKNEDIVFVGDRLYTDIAIGVNNGITSVLVLSGETLEEDLKQSGIKPDYVFKSISEMAEVIFDTH